jgi:hypothetical protein
MAAAMWRCDAEGAACLGIGEPRVDDGAQFLIAHRLDRPGDSRLDLLRLLDPDRQRAAPCGGDAGVVSEEAKPRSRLRVRLA